MNKSCHISLCNETVRLYNLHTPADNVSTTGVQFTQKGEPVGGEYLCTFEHAEGSWEYYRTIIDNESFYCSLEGLDFTLTGTMKYNILEKIVQDVSLFWISNTGIYGVIYRPVVYTVHFMPGNQYTIVLKGLQEPSHTSGNQLGFIYFPEKKKECLYCKSQNLRTFDSATQTTYNAQYYCQDCDRYIPLNTQSSHDCVSLRAKDALKHLHVYTEPMEYLKHFQQIISHYIEDMNS